MMLRRAFLKSCGAAIPLGFTGNILGEETGAENNLPLENSKTPEYISDIVEINPLQQYRELWEEVIYSINLDLEYHVLPKCANTLFSAYCECNGRKLSMKVRRAHFIDSQKTWIDLFRRDSEVTRAQFDATIPSGSHLGKRQYEEFKRATIQLFTISEEHFREIIDSKDMGKLEIFSLQDSDTKQALWNSEHMEEIRAEEIVESKLYQEKMDREWGIIK